MCTVLLLVLSLLSLSLSIYNLLQPVSDLGRMVPGCPSIVCESRAAVVANQAFACSFTPYLHPPLWPGHGPGRGAGGAVIGRPNADVLHHGPPPAYAHGREAVGGAEAWPQVQVHPGVSCAGHARRQACERRAAGWRVPAQPTMLRLNSQVLGF